MWVTAVQYLCTGPQYRTPVQYLSGWALPLLPSGHHRVRLEQAQAHLLQCESLQYSTSVQDHSTGPQYSTSAQDTSTGPQYRTSVQDLSTVIQYSTSVAGPQYRTLVQYRTSVQYLSRVGYLGTVSQYRTSVQYLSTVPQYSTSVQ